MFFSNNVLTKKGALAKIWLAAHFTDKKLTRNNIDDTNIMVAVKSIEEHTNNNNNENDAKELTASFSLRLSGQLLLGVCRIYQKKVKFLQDDATEVQLRIQQSLRTNGPTSNTSNVDLPQSNQASYINRAENWGDLDFPPLELDIDSIYLLNPNDEMPETNLNMGEFNIEDIDNLVQKEFDLPYKPTFDLEVEGARKEVHENDYLEEIPAEMMLPFTQSKTRESIAFESNDDVPLVPEVELGRKSVMFSTEDNFQQYEMPDIDMPEDLPPIDFRDSIGSVSAKDNIVESEVVEKERKKRKLKLIVNENTQLSKDDIRNNLNDRSDIIKTRGFIPLNKKQRHAAYRTSSNFVNHLLTNASTYSLNRLSSNLLALYKPFMTVGRVNLPHNPNGPSSIDEKEEELEEIQSEYLVSAENQNDPTFLADLPEMRDFDIPEYEPLEISQADTQPVDPTNEFVSNEMNAEESVELEESSQADATGWTARSKKMISKLQKDGLKTMKKFSVLANGTRKEAVAAFYELLLLKTRDVIKVKQVKPFEDIEISKGPKFSNPY